MADAIDYKVNKSLAYNQSKYFRNCLTASQKDRYPYVSCRLNDPLPEDVASFHVIMLWFANLPIGAGAFRDWCEDHEDLSLKDWCNVYTLAEELQIPRLEQHVSGAIKLKVMEDRILPSLANVKYIYSNGKKFCGLKHTFRDMYAIAAMEPKEVFGRDKVRFPPEFVWDVEAFNQSEAYVERRKAMMACERLDLGEEGEEGNGVGGDVDQEMTG